MDDPRQDGMTIRLGGAGQSSVAISGEVDMSNAARLHDAITEVAANSGRDVEVEVSGVTFIDSTGLNALVKAREELQSLGVAVVLRNPSPQVARILEITGLGRHFGAG